MISPEDCTDETMYYGFVKPYTSVLDLKSNICGDSCMYETLASELPEKFREISNINNEILIMRLPSAGFPQTKMWIWYQKRIIDGGVFNDGRLFISYKSTIRDDKLKIFLPACKKLLYQAIKYDENLINLILHSEKVELDVKQ